MATWVLLGVVGIIVLWLIGAYNSLVKGRYGVKNGWAQIDVQLKRRYDLIPNLVETCKGYLKHERETLEKVIQARNMGLQASGVKAQAEANNMLTDTLKSLFAVVENYPDLKANQNMLALQEELTSTENKIASAREFYNDSTARYNTQVQSFPTNFIANLFKFSPEEFFQAPETEKQAPKVSFS
ncbi:MAG: LemA family protein [Chlamydiae bacterium]|nr:LemA family protein [Chlamydiota bacterium]MBI3277289.1 LemA family protein [Chlamydiota bacterium]